MYKNNSITRRKNYIRVSNKHIFLNFNEKNFEDLEEIEGKERHQRIHVFITSHLHIDDSLYDLIKIYSDHTPITIHIPYYVKDLKVVVDDFLSKFNKKWKIFVERKGPVFKGNDQTMLRINYQNKGIQAALSFGAAEYTGYKLQYPTLSDKEPGAIKSMPMQLHPELFKDQIIENFKKSCPEGILNAAFDTDEKIWDYVIQNGEWNVKQEE